MSLKIPVAILGATGTVGQKFVRLLADHPWFEITAVAASSVSAGRRYEEVARWREPVPVPSAVAGMVVQECAPPLPGRIVFRRWMPRWRARSSRRLLERAPWW